MLLNHSTLHDAFFSQAAKTPDLPCLVDAFNELTYSQTQQAIHAFAEAFKKAGVIKHTVVGLYSEKNVELIVAFLAVSALGGQCVQLDKAFPNSFLVDVIAETKTKIMLCDDDIAFENVKTINITRLLEQVSNLDCKNDITPTENKVTKDDTVWLVYSSGTTGTHKGIAIAHKAILASYDMRNTIKSYNEYSRVGCSIYYLWEVFRPIVCGGCSYVINDDILHDFERLNQFIVTHNINEFLFTPSYLEMLLHTAPNTAKSIFSHLDTCWLNGEVVSSGLYHQLMPYMEDTAIYNLYSISECHDVALYRLTKKDSVFDAEQVMPVGYLLDDVETVLLDEAGNICNPGQKGELYVYSPGLAEEYINRSELNKERFITADKSPIGKRLYKTGDLARLIENEKLVIIYGRCDYFVRLRGYNISLPFLEAILKDKLDLVHCVVVKQGESSASEYLEAYLEIPLEKQSAFKKKWQLDEGALSSRELISHIAAHMPNYMVPQAFNIVSQIPINPYSNKLDRKGLEKQKSPFDIKAFGQVKDLEGYRKLWAKLLNTTLDKIENEDGFFDLGGTSLLAMVLISHAPKLGLNRVSIKDFIAKSVFEQSYQLFTSNHSETQDSISTILKDIDTCINQVKDYYLVNRPERKSDSGSKNKTCLLTGATGFLGSHLLQELLLSSEDNIICLVRGKSPDECQERVNRSLKKLGLNQAQFIQRITVLKSDISAVRLGLSIESWQSLAKQADYVINAAANVNLVLPYQSMKKVCVDGVKNLIEICFKYSLKPFYQVSTNGIFPESLEPKPEDNQIGNYIYNLDSGYSQAKWASERILNCAMDIGLPVTIFRPGNIFAVDQNNINETDMNWLILKSINTLKAIPQGLKLEMTPVDKIAKCIISCVQNENDNQIYNMTNPSYLSGKTLADAFDLQEISKDKWLSSLKDEKLKVLLNHYDGWLDATTEYQQRNYTKLLLKLKLINDNYIKNQLVICLFQS